MGCRYRRDNAILDLQTSSGKVTAIQTCDDCAAAESVGEFSYEGGQQILIDISWEVGQVDLNSCSFGQRQ